ncbi:MAG: hypothetical protein KDC48_07860 [Planctomycetes bacterium]|nr:hypothetical protein [Planctomycetota bacterium]
MIDRTQCAIALSLLTLASTAAAQWTQATPATSPSPRTRPAMAFDGNATVLFGGADISGFPPTNFADTWTWNGATWTQRSPATSPPARHFAGMAHDVQRARTVLYGGLNTTLIQSQYRDDTWEWDGTNWTQVTTAHSPGSIFGSNGVGEVSMAYDLIGQRVVLFGGELFQGIVPAPALTLEYDGVDWTQATTAVAPPRRSQAALCSAPTLGGVLLFGGTNFNNPPGPLGEITWNDTWMYSSLSHTWTQLNPTGPLPPPRAGASLLFDGNTGLCVMHGGYGSGASSITPFSDTWVFDGTSWTDVTATYGTPSGPRVRFSTSEGPANLHVLFGGTTAFFSAPNNETWVQGPLAEAVTFGAGCNGSNGTPALNVGTRPVLGTGFRLDVANLPPGSLFGFGLVGFSDTLSPLGLLPLNLAPFGLGAGCNLLCSGEATNLFPVNGATGSVTFNLSGDPAFSGLFFYYQFASIDAAAPGGFAVSNGVRARFGIY